MAARADVETHIGRRSEAISTALADWADPGLDAPQRLDVVESYFSHANLGEARRLDTSASVVLERCRAPRGAPTLLVVGSHDISALAPTRSDRTRPNGTSDLRGPGIGSTFGSMVAFVEGFTAALATGRDEPVNVRFLSVGRQGRLAEAVAAVQTDDIDAVFFTNSINWDPQHPTITTGARGRLEVKVTIAAGHAVNDGVFAGAIRNPLNRLVEILGHLRDDRGKIAIPNFYGRAGAPTEAERGALAAAGFDPSAWIVGLDVRRPQGSLSALERATLWPVISITDVHTETNGDVTAGTTPAAATATLLIYLIPDQRPVEIESALRTWIRDQVPANLTTTVTVASAARPYRSSTEQQVVAAQARAASRVSGRAPVFVPGGGSIGAGEVHFATGAPVGFAGISGPRTGFGTTEEVVPRALFDLGVAQAAETCLQVPRRTAVRSTS